MTVLPPGNFFSSIVFHHRLYRHIRALDHARQHRSWRDAVLIRIDADGKLARFLRGLNDAKPGSAGDLVDDVRAAIEHGLSHLKPNGRITEIVGVGDLDLDIRIDGASAFNITDDELVDADRLGAADHTDYRFAAHTLD